MIYDINNDDIKDVAADNKNTITYDNIFLNKIILSYAETDITFNSGPVYWYNFESL